MFDVFRSCSSPRSSNCYAIHSVLGIICKSQWMQRPGDYLERKIKLEGPSKRASHPPHRRRVQETSCYGRGGGSARECACSAG